MDTKEILIGAAILGGAYFLFVRRSTVVGPLGSGAVAGMPIGQGPLPQNGASVNGVPAATYINPTTGRKVTVVPPINIKGILSPGSDPSLGGSGRISLPTAIQHQTPATPVSSIALGGATAFGVAAGGPAAPVTAGFIGLREIISSLGIGQRYDPGLAGAFEDPNSKLNQALKGGQVNDHRKSRGPRPSTVTTNDQRRK